MDESKEFSKIRRDVEASQKSILWEDAIKNGRSVDAFLWRGDRRAKPVQRAGLVVFAITFLSLAIAMFYVAFSREAIDDKIALSCLAFLVFLLAARLMRNAFLREPKQDSEEEGRRKR